MNELLHSEPLTPADIKRFAPPNIVVNMNQPSALTDFTIVELAVLLGFVQMKLKEEYKSDAIFESIARKARARIAEPLISVFPFEADSPYCLFHG